MLFSNMFYYQFFFLIVFSFLPSAFWLFWYYFYFPRFTTSKSFLGVLFFLGMVSAGAGFLIHQQIMKLFPNFVLEIFQKNFLGFQTFTIGEVLIMFSLMFFLVAPIEEFLKFLSIKLAMSRKPEYLNQIIDGIKFGIVVGLGFAVVENAVYFYQPLLEGEKSIFLKLFLARFLISTLAHSLYTGIMGYYIGLSQLYRLHKNYLLRRGFLLATAIHGAFNFFLLINLGFFSIAVLIVLLWFMIKWGRDRENLESFIHKQEYGKIFVPVFSGKKEFESFLFRYRIRYNVIKKLNLCPFCFRKRTPGQEICPYCKNRYPS